MKNSWMQIIIRDRSCTVPSSAATWLASITNLLQVCPQHFLSSQKSVFSLIVSNKHILNSSSEKLGLQFTHFSKSKKWEVETYLSAPTPFIWYTHNKPIFIRFTPTFFVLPDSYRAIFFYKALFFSRIRPAGCKWCPDCMKCWPYCQIGFWAVLGNGATFNQVKENLLVENL